MASAMGFVSYLFAGFGLLTPDAPIVNISSGKLQGLVATSRGGIPYYEYLGIPYAKSPVNELRFEPPVALSESDRWKGIRSAKHYASPCVQFDAQIYGRIIGTEDCLYLNVYTPRVTGKLPVLVNFHEGGFTSGDAREFGAKYFMDEELIVVTMNFRLYVLGFLNTNDEVRGNMGLKDQNMALLWIQQNIKKFGGDPDRVILMGSGTGAVSVHFHVLSKKSKGLFIKAISQSGTAAHPWAFIRDPLSQAKRYGKKINCPTRNTSALVKCLRKKKARELIQISEDLMSPVHTQEDFFTGTVEAVKREDTFLSESPFDILELGNFNKVPWILGVNSGEGGYKISKFLAYPEIQANVGRRWKEYAPILAHYDPNKTEVTDKLRQYYFGGSKYLNPGYDLENLTQMISDLNYFHPTSYAATRHARHATTYLYFFTYQTIRFPNICSVYRAVRHDDWLPSEFKIIYTVAEDISKKYISRESESYETDGVCPNQQSPLLWNSHLVSEIWKTSPDYYFSKAMIRMIADFIENDDTRLKFDGLPWPPISTKRQLVYMKLDRPPRLIDEPFTKRFNFIDSLNIRSGHDMRNW